MKKNILKTISVIALSVFALTSCSEAPEADTNESSSDIEINHDAEENNQNVSYICPMDCEDGKTYNEAIDCPVCGMEIK